jgi:Tfp pilus assembly protein PilN
MRAVNLLTPELRTAQKGSGAPRVSMLETSGGIGAFAVLGALALCVAGVAGYVLSGNVVKERKAALAEVSTKNEQTVKRVADLKPYADFQTIAQERASTVTALASARFDWDEALRDLSRALPTNVYLSSVSGDVGGASAATGSASGLRSSRAAPAISLAGCTRTQPAVASLMSRLRNIQGVTRVSLSKSAKADATGSSSGAETGPCGKGSPPSFELVVFFEKATIGADLANATKDVAASDKPAAATPADKDSKAGATPTPAASKEGATP